MGGHKDIYNDFDDFGDDFDEFDDEEDFGEVNFEASGLIGSDGLDIPDFFEIVKDLIQRGVANGIEDISRAICNDDEFRESARRVLSLETVYETGAKEAIPAMSRNLLTLISSEKTTFGTLICQTLVADLRQHQDRLLFGLLENLYLHCSRSFTFANDRICASLRVYWDERPSPYPLVISNATDISQNRELVYLLVGDLVGDMLDGIDSS